MASLKSYPFQGLASAAKAAFLLGSERRTEAPRRPKACSSLVRKDFAARPGGLGRPVPKGSLLLEEVLDAFGVEIKVDEAVAVVEFDIEHLEHGEAEEA